MEVAVFGAGISGLFAAWACENAEVDYTVYTDNLDFPEVEGFTYLHDRCDMNLTQHRLKQRVMVPDNWSRESSIAFYSKLVYGLESVSNSLENVFDTPEKNIYSMKDALKIIVPRVTSHIVQRRMRNLEEVVKLTKQKFDVGYCSIPIDALHRDGVYEFVEAFVLSSESLDSNVVFYNGGITASYGYRWGTLFGQGFVESKQGPGKKIKKVMKAKYRPVLPENVLLIGRYGAWDKTQLAHTVYNKVKGDLEERFNG